MQRVGAGIAIARKTLGERLCFEDRETHAPFVATEPTAAARELVADLGVPFTFTAHGYDIRRKPPADFADRAAAAAAVITVSQANARHIRDTFAVG